MRKPVIIGNWKMNGSIDDIKTFIKNIKPSINNEVDSGLAVPYTLISTLAKETEKLNFKVGAQNMHFDELGAYTGELSAKMIIEAGADIVIIGHSERRMYYNETDAAVNLKIKSALKNNIIPIICCGESLEERENFQAEKIIENQIKAAFVGISKENLSKTIIAYEPIWAIGTGKTASTEDAEAMAMHIRNTIKSLYDVETSEKIRIQYGGSVKPSNIKDIMSMPNIDGALVGGASLKAEDFIKLIKFFE